MRLRPSPALLFAHAVVGMFIFGLVLALPGTLFGVPAWTAAVGGDVATQANLLVVFFAGQLTCTAAAGILVDHVGAQRVLLGGGALAAGGFLLLARAASPPAAAVGLALLAAGGSSFNAGSNTLVSVTFGARRGAMLPLMGVACAIGACLTPFVLSASASVATIAERLLVLAAASAVSTIVPLAIGRVPHLSAGISLRSMLSIASDRWLIGLTALTAIEFGVEAVIAGWSAVYALAVVPGASGGLVVTLYWAALAGGRSLTPLVLRWRSKASTVAAASGLVAAGIAVMAQAASPAALYSGALLTGMAVGPLAPTLIAVAGDRYPQRTGLAIGVLLSLAQLGGVTLPWLTGRAALAEGFRTAMVVPLVGALVVLAGAATIRIRRAP